MSENKKCEATVRQLRDEIHGAVYSGTAKQYYKEPYYTQIQPQLDIVLKQIAEYLKENKLEFGTLEAVKPLNAVYVEKRLREFIAGSLFDVVVEQPKSLPESLTSRELMLNDIQYESAKISNVIDEFRLNNNANLATALSWILHAALDPSQKFIYIQRAIMLLNKEAGTL